ncbi:rRNA maturation RNase YbeY [Marinimicrococcus flavescens]|uniref:Endoribonuclease YbeY n=1 Tax=Marinimicrococcus flavescens TaxID=3031815 RepID=A0AAP3XQ88_9PROT|nr:rRNA maturation RNase YbeY [Marinimicrococcus flavescens]
MDSESSHSIAVTIEAPGWPSVVTAPEALCREAVRAVLARLRPDDAERIEVSILLADDETVRALNRDYRGKDKPTNVLSFPAELEVELPEEAPCLLGDIVLALETVREEAMREGKQAAHHLSHLVVHGTLHLLGHDHEEAEEAERMEALETQILAGLGIADPYAVDAAS